MDLAVDGIQPDHLAGQVEAQDLLAAVFAGGIGLDRAGLDDIEGAETLAAAEQIVPAMQGAGALDDIIQTFDIVRGQAHGQAKAGQGAVAAGDPQHLERNDLLGSQNRVSPANKTRYFGPLIDLDQADATNSGASGLTKKAAPKGAA